MRPPSRASEAMSDALPLVISRPFVLNGQSRRTAICIWCAEPFPALDWEIERGRGWHCSRRCANFAMRSSIDGVPELAELVRLLYPVMRTQDLADFLGIGRKTLDHYASRRGIHKSPEWKRATGKGRMWPDDPALREVHALRLTLKRAVTRREKELQ